MTLIAYGCILGLVFIGPWAIHFLFGHQYERSIDVLRIHALACLPYFLLEWRYQILVTTDQTRLSALLLWMGCAFALIFNLLLIPKYGAVGAAWAVFLAYMICGPIACLLIPRLRWVAIIQFKALFFPFVILISPVKTWNSIIRPLLRPNKPASEQSSPPDA